jgi:hypothetical protein
MFNCNICDQATHTDYFIYSTEGSENCCCVFNKRKYNENQGISEITKININRWIIVHSSLDKHSAMRVAIQSGSHRCKYLKY